MSSDCGIETTLGTHAAFVCAIALNRGTDLNIVFVILVALAVAFVVAVTVMFVRAFVGSLIESMRGQRLIRLGPAPPHTTPDQARIFSMLGSTSTSAATVARTRRP
ncbi:hypothetical protein M3A96_07435 [Helcobacillus massiliensis]|uniref:hypothetical protein n=1 Tax=Helcobacillus massiliensis TaxID=521392 RepID=UPI0021A8F336|nr:hypothetical protein [Helcobacillus massiliensis]MCT1557947.1 hypothetical protein [Helcobacillus massiliensis]MCT2037346.1 hypothetical protein [Helcobacillus massiliensis]MCT2332949.1 hypothetical protein [Helcobacillus massiliensis]